MKKCKECGDALECINTHYCDYKYSDSTQFIAALIKDNRELRRELAEEQAACHQAIMAGQEAIRERDDVLELLRKVALSHGELDHPWVSYVPVHIDRELWNQIWNRLMAVKEDV